MTDVTKASMVTVTKAYEKKEYEDVSLEDALDHTGYGWYNVKLCAVSMFMLMAMALEVFGLGFLLAGSACDLGLDDTKRGLVATMPMLGVIVSAYGWGVAADRRGRRRALLVSLGGAFLVSAVGCFSPHWMVFAIAKFISSAFASATNAVAYTLFGESTPRRYRDKMLMFITSGFMFSQGVMALLSWPVLQINVDVPIPFLGIRLLPWRILALLAATPCGIGALALSTCEESPKFLLTRGRHDEAMKVLQKMYAINTGRKPEEYPVKSLHLDASDDKSRHVSAARALWEQAAPLFRPPLLRHSLVITYVVIVVYMVPPSFMMWLPTITNRFFTALEGGTVSSADNFCSVINRHVHYNATLGPPQCDDNVNILAAATVVFISGMCCVTSSLLTWCVGRGLRKRHLVLAMNAAAGAGGLLLNAVPVPAAAALFVVSIVTVACMGLMTAFTVQVFPTSLRAMSVCLTMMIGRGFSVIGMNLIGNLMESHCEMTYYIFGGITLSGALASLLLPGDEQNADVKKTAEV